MFRSNLNKDEQKSISIVLNISCKDTQKTITTQTKFLLHTLLV